MILTTTETVPGREVSEIIGIAKGSLFARDLSVVILLPVFAHWSVVRLTNTRN